MEKTEKRFRNSIRACTSAIVYYGKKVERVDFIREKLHMIYGNTPVAFEVCFPEGPGMKAVTGPQKDKIHLALSEALESWHREHEHAKAEHPPKACVFVCFGRDSLPLSPRDAAETMRAETCGNEKTCPEEQFGWMNEDISEAEALLIAEEKRVEERIAKEKAAELQKALAAKNDEPADGESKVVQLREAAMAA